MPKDSCVPDTVDSSTIFKVSRTETISASTNALSRAAADEDRSSLASECNETEPPGWGVSAAATSASESEDTTEGGEGKGHLRLALLFNA